MNFPPSLFLIAHLCSLISKESLSLSLSTHVSTHEHTQTHTHAHMILHHHPTSILPGRRKMVQERGNIRLRDLIMLISVNSYLLHLHSL